MATRKRKRTTDVVADLARSVCDLRSLVERVDGLIGPITGRLCALEAASRLNSFASARPEAVESPMTGHDDAVMRDQALRFAGFVPAPPVVRGSRMAVETESPANIRPDKAKERALRRWYEDDGVAPSIGPGGRAVRAIPQARVEIINKALNGNFNEYDEGAAAHADMLALSVVARLEKKVDALDRAVRFLVERTPGA